MAIVWRTVTGNFIATLYEVLRNLENPNNPMTLHSVSTPTIGIGFDLGTTGGGVEVRKAVLRQMGLDVDHAWTGTTFTPGSPQAKEQQYIQSLIDLMNGNSTSQTAYNAIMSQRANDLDLAYQAAYPTRRAIFAFANDNEVQAAFAEVWEPVYRDDIFQTLSSSITTNTDFQNSKELIAIACARWVGTWGPSAQNALNNGNRAKAWYEIRYGWEDNNPAYNNGWAKRHYFESAVFGLYNDPANATATPEEAKLTYEMLTINRDRIMRREFQYGIPPDGTTNSNNWINQANTFYATALATVGSNPVQSLTATLSPAYTAFINYANTLHGANAPDIDKSITKGTGVDLFLTS